MGIGPRQLEPGYGDKLSGLRLAILIRSVFNECVATPDEGQLCCDDMSEGITCVIATCFDQEVVLMDVDLRVVSTEVSVEMGEDE